MSGFSVDTEELEAAAKRLREAITYLEQASSYSEEADPDWWMWGLPGLIFAPKYFAYSDSWRGFLDKTVSSVEGLAGRLDGSKGNYDDIDSAMSEDMARIVNDVEASYNTYANSNQKEKKY
ncbi:hypothetical protein [Haloglycomyces albus]|uniref:hypothetical protein n=1 Tax=Haloglycomyces albus TaxID=526067 RepID=UPI00046D1325|nr:hypothetical protein [Haloglycomyces albus]